VKATLHQDFSETSSPVEHTVARNTGLCRAFTRVPVKLRQDDLTVKLVVPDPLVRSGWRSRSP